jgi:tRNA G46 methylase TrmB
MYERFMEKTRLVTNKMLEVGFGEGGSVKMWQEYFPNAEIYCMEYFDKEYAETWHSPSTDVPDLNVIRGDSTKPEPWLEVPFELDFIVDDGSHFPKDQMETFALGFSHLKSGGF